MISKEEAIVLAVVIVLLVVGLILSFPLGKQRINVVIGMSLIIISANLSVAYGIFMINRYLESIK